MANENLKRALYDALIPEYVAVMRNADDTVHEFSPRFEYKMHKLIKRRNKPYYSLINTLGKRVACIAVIILVASSVTVMSVKALREAVANFFIEIFEKFSIVQSVEDSAAPDTIEDIYDITYDLDGFEVIYDEKSDGKIWKTYIKDDIIIDYRQYTKDEYQKNLNTENTVITTIDINGYEAVYYLDNQNYNNLIFDNGSYIIDIMSNVDKQTFIDIAKSVHKVESE